MAELNLWTAIAAVGAPSVTALGGWLAAKRKGKSEDAAAQAALLKSVQDSARDMIASLEARVASLQSRVDSVETKLESERQAWREERHKLSQDLMIAIGRAEQAERACAAGVGERRQLQQRIDSLQRQLQALGVDVPDAPVRATEPVLMGVESD